MKLSDTLRALKPFVVSKRQARSACARPHPFFMHRGYPSTTAYLSPWTKLYFSRNRYTIERDLNDSLYFLNADVQTVVC